MISLYALPECRCPVLPRLVYARARLHQHAHHLEVPVCRRDDERRGPVLRRLVHARARLRVQPFDAVGGVDEGLEVLEHGSRRAAAGDPGRGGAVCFWNGSGPVVATLANMAMSFGCMLPAAGRRIISVNLIFLRPKQQIFHGFQP